MKRNILATMALPIALAFSGAATAQTEARKPNILVIWGDDIGVHNISAYNHGVMGYRTPNIDRIAKEGALFTDSYAQQSCTAGRASFILGQHPFRTGLLAGGAWIRRVLRQPLPPECRRGAGDVLLSEGSVVQGEVRAARLAP